MSGGTATAFANLEAAVAALGRVFVHSHSGTFTTQDINPGQAERTVITHGLGTDSVIVILGGYNHVSPSKFEAFWRRPDGAVGRCIGPENASLPNVAHGPGAAPGTVDIWAINNSAGTTKVTVTFMVMTV